VDYIDASQVVQGPLAFMNADHADEVRLLQELGRALAAHRQDGDLAPVLERLALLAVHAREHFLKEEQVMREARYPGYLAHKAEHDRVLADMDEEARRFRDGRDADRLERFLFEVVPAWFVEHIRTMDLATADFVAARRRPDA
jgi:hemerythrin